MRSRRFSLNPLRLATSKHESPMSPSPLNPSRTIGYVLAALSQQGIRPTTDAQRGRLPKGIQAIMPAQAELDPTEIDRAIYTHEIEIQRKMRDGTITLSVSTYLVPSATPKTLDQTDFLSLEVARPTFVEYASFDILGDRAIPLFDHHARPEGYTSIVWAPAQEKAYSRQEKAFLEPKDSLKVMDWSISEFLRLTQ